MPEPTAVYRLYGPGEVLLYVGIAQRPEARWVQHAGEKAWWRDVRTLTVEWHDSRTAALMAETHAIEHEKPLHNGVAGKLQEAPGKTPNRVIRVDDELWTDYGRACEDEGAIRSEDLRAYMQRKVRAWKRRRNTGQRDDG